MPDYRINYCKKCGSKLPPDSNFCNKCGAPIGSLLDFEPEAKEIDDKAAGIDTRKKFDIIQKETKAFYKKVINAIKEKPKKALIPLVTVLAVAALLGISQLGTLAIAKPKRDLDFKEIGNTDPTDNKTVPGLSVSRKASAAFDPEQEQEVTNSLGEVLVTPAVLLEKQAYTKAYTTCDFVTPAYYEADSSGYRAIICSCHLSNTVGIVQVRIPYNLYVRYIDSSLGRTSTGYGFMSIRNKTISFPNTIVFHGELRFSGSEYVRYTNYKGTEYGTLKKFTNARLFLYCTSIS